MHVSSIGSRAEALRCVEHAKTRVPAYGKFLAEQGAASARFDELPLTDKRSYLTRYTFGDLLAPERDEAFTIFSSSGSSGQPFYWPQLKASHRTSGEALRRFLESVFPVQERRTLAIVGLALGSWIGGDYFSWVLKSMALETPYPFVVFSPGNKHGEILDMIHKAEAFVDQIILFVCPSAIGHLLLRAEQERQPLPLAKLRYSVIGEPFPELLRASLQRCAGPDAAEPVIFSIYGSADTGVLGFESPASVMMRRRCHENPQLAHDLGFAGGVPHFFHLADARVYLEAIGGELCVTKWQGIPLMRYNLHDSVRLMNWRALTARASLPPSDDLPDVLAILGRSDSCLILCGTNLTEFMLDEAVRSAELQPLLTGLYRAGIAFSGERQRLEFTVELKRDVPADEAVVDRIYPLLVKALGRVQPEFKDDWNNVYRRWDCDPANRILQIRAVPWPVLSGDTETGIKQRGIGK